MLQLFFKIVFCCLHLVAVFLSVIYLTPVDYMKILWIFTVFIVITVRFPYMDSLLVTIQCVSPLYYELKKGYCS